jgi:hypothetical protein
LCQHNSTPSFAEVQDVQAIQAGTVETVAFSGESLLTVFIGRQEISSRREFDDPSQLLLE